MRIDPDWRGWWGLLRILKVWRRNCGGGCRRYDRLCFTWRWAFWQIWRNCGMGWNQLKQSCLGLFEWTAVWNWQNGWLANWEIGRLAEWQLRKLKVQSHSTIFGNLNSFFLELFLIKRESYDINQSSRRYYHFFKKEKLILLPDVNLSYPWRQFFITFIY